MKSSESGKCCITGISLRWFKSETISHAWEVVSSLEETPVREVPQDRRSVNTSFQAAPGVWGEHVNSFDPVFFGMTPKESSSTDPAIRLALTCSWEAIENAGVLKCHTEDFGTYAGVSNTDYLHRLFATDSIQNCLFWAVGNTASSIAGRVAYTLGARGPSMSIDAACASSLVALTVALHDTLSLKCKGAVVVGTHTITCHQFSPLYHAIGLLARDGRCKTFDSAADGFGRADATIAITLQHQSDIRCIPWAIALNGGCSQDGDTKKSFALTSGTSQASLIRKITSAVKEGNLIVGQEEISLYFPHGNGSLSSDKEEVRAISEAYVRGKRDVPLAVCPLKTKTSHTEAASGLLSIAMICLSMHYDIIPRIINLKTLHPEIGQSSFETNNLAISFENVQWSSGKKIAAETSFGLGGSIAHVMVQNWTDVSKKLSNTGSIGILNLQLQNEVTCSDLSKKYLEILEEYSLPMDCFAAASFFTRENFAKRVGLYYSSKKELTSSLKSISLLGINARGLDGILPAFNPVRANQPISGHLICGPYEKRGVMEQFEQTLATIKDLLSAGVSFSKNLFGVGPGAFALAVAAKRISEKDARDSISSAYFKNIQSVLVATTRCRWMSDIFQDAKWWPKVCSIEGKNMKHSVNIVTCFGMRSIVVRKLTLNEKLQGQIEKLGIVSNPFDPPKQGIFLKIGRWPEGWSIVRQAKCQAIHCISLRGRHSGSMMACLSYLKCAGFTSIRKTSDKELFARIPSYAFLKRSFWTQIKSDTNDQNGKYSEIFEDSYGKCDFCGKSVTGKNLIILGTSVLHTSCKEKYEYVNQPCLSCGIVLNDLPRVQHSGNYFHEKCFDDNFRCFLCKRGIDVGHVVQFNEKNFHQECMLQARQRDLRCAICKEFLSDDVVLLNDEKIHISCLSQKRRQDAVEKQAMLKARLQKVSQPELKEGKKGENDTGNSRATLRKIVGDTIGERVLSILRFCLETENILPETVLRDAGLSSLSGIKIRTLVQQHTDVILPSTFTTDFANAREIIGFVEKNHGTIKDPDEIESGIVSSSEEAEVVWKEKLASLVPVKSDFLNEKRKGVLITGASGFLGAELVRFISRTNVVFCIVRGKSTVEASKRVTDILQNDFVEKNVKIFAGDLELPLFGLERSVYESIGKSCRLVIHGAALVHWTAPYAYLKQANVGATANVAEFCMKFHVSLTYIGTLGIFSPFSEFPKRDEDCDLKSLNTVEHWQGIPVDQRGYTQSKYVGELLVQRLRSIGFPALVVRVPFLGPSIHSGRCSTDQYDIRMFLSIIISGKYYRPYHRTAKINWVPVDYCAEIIWKISNDMNSYIEQYPDATFHVAHPSDGTSLAQIIRCFEAFGYDLEVVSKEQWLEIVDEKSLPAKPFLNLLRLEIDELPLGWKSSRVENVAKAFDFSRFSINSSYIFRMCQYLASCNLIKVPKVIDCPEVELDFVLKPLDMGYVKKREDPTMFRYGWARILIQFLLISFQIITLSSSFYPAILFLSWTFQIGWWGIFLIPLSVPIYAGSLMFFLILLKWIVVGRMKPGRHKLWSLFFFRWWFIHQLQNLTTLTVVGKIGLEGTIFSWAYYSMMGGKISLSATIRAHLQDCDLIEMGQDAGTESQISGHRFDADGYLVLDRVIVSNGSWIEDSAVILSGCTIPSYCKILHGSLLTKEDDLSKIPKGCTIYGNDPIEALPGTFSPNTRRENIFLYIIRSILMVIVRAYSMVCCFAPSIYLFFYVSQNLGSWWSLLALWGLLPLVVFSYLIELIAIKWILLGNVTCCMKNSEKSYSWKGWHAFRRDLFLSAYGVLGGPAQKLLAFTIWQNLFLRAMGARIGLYCTIGSIDCFAEWDFLSIGKRTFCGLGSTYKCYQYDDSKITFRRINVGKDCFIGSFSQISSPCSLGDFCQVLPASHCFRESTGDEVQIAGNPSFPISMNRQIPPVPAGRNVFFDFAFSSIFWAVLAVSVVCGFLSAQEVFLKLVVVFGTSQYLFPLYLSVAISVFLPCFGLASLIVSIILYNFCDLLTAKRDKNIQIEKFRAQLLGIVSLCCSGLGGTSFASIIWRASGAKIGRNCFFDPSVLTDPRLFKCDDGCVVLGSFDLGFGENSDTRRIGVYLGEGSTIQRGAFIIDGFCCDKKTLVMSTSVPDNLTKSSSGKKFRGYLQHGRDKENAAVVIKKNETL